MSAASARQVGSEPSSAGGLADSLQAALVTGGISAALGLCQARLQTFPEDADAYRHLGQLRAACGEELPALRAAMRACELAPDDPRAWSDLGRVHALSGELEQAARCFDEAVEIDVRYADGWHNLGTALKKLGRREAAFAALKNALLLEPTRAATYLVLGNLLIEANQFDDALECFERAARHDPTLARARCRLADQMWQRGRVKRAEVLFRQSLGLDPGHIEGWLGLARTLEDLGEAESARGAYLNVLRRRPDNATALGSYLALLNEVDVADGETTALLDRAESALSSDAVTDQAKALIGYGLAKYCDRRREFGRAARAGLAANAARRRATGPLDREALSARVDGLITTYDADFFAARRRFGVGTDQPVFIVGLPRSGTTLTEQILSAHPHLHGAGELPDLARLALKVADADEPWRAATRLDENGSRVVAGEYLLALRAGTSSRQLRISDKAPLNFFQLAFAAVLFPGARVIHCRRIARDTALSIWMENFNSEQRYATDFEEIAFFASQYERLMAHWREVLPLPILEMQYEDTIANVEERARHLTDFLGAPWDSRCVDFHKNGRAVQTPSRWQVRQPIYSHSVHRWKDYAKYLPDLESAFPSTGAKACSERS